jgi:DNA-binding phage protein
MPDVAKPRTGAERYLSSRLNSPEYRAEYQTARDRIARIDTVVRSLDGRREEMGLAKAELARRAGMKPEAIRRLFSVERPNPTLSTLVALAGALDLEIRPEPLPSQTRVTASRIVAPRTRARTA